jgi:hypothetical protein
MSTNVFSQIFAHIASGISETYNLDQKAVLELVETVLKSTVVNVKTGEEAVIEKPQAVKCSWILKKGNAGSSCMRNAQDGEYCKQHAILHEKEKTRVVVERKQCEHLNKDNIQCKSKANTDSTLCSTHSKKTRVVEREQCEHVNKDGTRCESKSTKDSTLCSVHENLDLLTDLMRCRNLPSFSVDKESGFQVNGIDNTVLESLVGKVKTASVTSFLATFTDEGLTVKWGDRRGQERNISSIPADWEEIFDMVRKLL